MDAFDLSAYSDLVPRRVRKFVAVAFIVAMAFLPPVREWYVQQAMLHGEDVAKEIVRHFDFAPSPALAIPTPPVKP